MADSVTSTASAGTIRSTRNPKKVTRVGERSKLPEGAAESQVRETLSRRYDLCDWTVVSTATLLTAVDRQDTARWT